MASRETLSTALFDALRSADPKLVVALGAELEAYRAAYLSGRRLRVPPLLRDLLDAIEDVAELGHSDALQRMRQEDAKADPVQKFFDDLPAAGAKP